MLRPAPTPTFPPGRSTGQVRPDASVFAGVAGTEGERPFASPEAAAERHAQLARLIVEAQRGRRKSDGGGLPRFAPNLPDLARELREPLLRIIVHRAHLGLDNLVGVDGRLIDRPLGLFVRVALAFRDAFVELADIDGVGRLHALGHIGDEHRLVGISSLERQRVEPLAGSVGIIDGSVLQIALEALDIGYAAVDLFHFGIEPIDLHVRGVKLAAVDRVGRVRVQVARGDIGDLGAVSPLQRQGALAFVVIADAIRSGIRNDVEELAAVDGILRILRHRTVCHIRDLHAAGIDAIGRDARPPR